MEHAKHFVLIHGAGHGAWCWYKVATLLTSKGHKVTALDLASSGINPKQFNEIRSLSGYVEPLIEFMESLPHNERIILVGHSVGGPSISIAMERFPEKISAAVFATAAMPGPHLPYQMRTNKKYYGKTVQIIGGADFMDSEFRFDDESNNLPTALLLGPKFLSSLYQLSPLEDLTLAFSLVRFHPLLSEEIKLTNEKYGSVRRVFITCDQDHTMKENVLRWMIDKNPPDEVKVINGADHMVMLSKPLELFSYLHEVAERFS